MASNQKTFAIVGCGCLGLAVIIVAVIVMLASGLFALLKGSDPYQASLAKVQAHPKVTAALGTPIEAGFLVTGNVNLENNNGEADISYTVSGPNGKAEVHVSGSKQADAWTYREMTATLQESGEIVNLMEGP